jgi:hypothetical protein
MRPGRWACGCAVVVAMSGCAASVYRPTQPRPAIGPGIAADIVSIRGPAGMAELSIRSQQPTLIGPISWSSGAAESCSAAAALDVGRDLHFDLDTTLPAQFESNGSDVVFVNLGKGLGVAGPGRFLDVAVNSGQVQGCLRLPLTAAGTETLWRADRVPRIIGLGLRLESPLSRLEGTGLRLATELRVLHQVGPVRAFFGFTLGGAGCRGADCPPLDFSDEDDQESSGLFFHVGGEVGLERRMSLGRWSLGVTLGGSLAYFHLGAHAGYAAGKNLGVGGPFASVTLFGPKGDVVPGFSPTARRGSHGPEIFAARQTAFGRGPTESAWLAGLGWRLEFTN